MHTVPQIIHALCHNRLCLTDEKQTQVEIEAILKEAGIQYEKEYRLDKSSIPDFFINGIAIEIKIKGTSKQIYRQCERYCKFEQVKELILVTNKSMGFPTEINNKPCYILNLGKAWL